MQRIWTCDSAHLPSRRAGPFDRGCDPVLHGRREIGIHREADHLVCQPLRNRKVPLDAVLAIGGLKMERHRVMDSRGYALRLEARFELRAIAREHRVLGVNARAARSYRE